MLRTSRFRGAVTACPTCPAWRSWRPRQLHSLATEINHPTPDSDWTLLAFASAPCPADSLARRSHFASCLHCTKQRGSHECAPCDVDLNRAPKKHLHRSIRHINCRHHPSFAVEASRTSKDCVLINAELKLPSCKSFCPGASATQTTGVLVNVEPSKHYTNTSTREYSPHKLQSKDAPFEFCMTPSLTASPQEPSLHKLQSRRRLSAQNVRYSCVLCHVELHAASRSRETVHHINYRCSNGIGHRSHEDGCPHSMSDAAVSCATSSSMELPHRERPFTT
ncbi:uncharacterized protein [Dermacentor albipictus]|uniref:uncharacterized protein isoform X2 n=1 Tax=Dermacentor albipictus TaxID=60249 RepID=UPI0031FD5C2D